MDYFYRGEMIVDLLESRSGSRVKLWKKGIQFDSLSLSAQDRFGLTS